MLETILAFLAAAFAVQLSEEEQALEDRERRRRLDERVRERLFPPPEGVSHPRLARHAWEAAFVQLGRYEDDRDEDTGFTPEEQWLRTFMVYGDKFLEESGKPQTLPALPPCLEWSTELVHVPSYGPGFTESAWRREPKIEWSDAAGFRIANSGDAEWATKLWLIHFGAHSPVVAVWTSSGEDLMEALEEAAEAAREWGWNGVFVEPEYPEGVEYDDDPEAYEEAEADLTQTESGWIGYDWGVYREIEDPFRGSGRRWASRGYRPDDFDYGDEATRLWVAYKIRSAPEGD